MSDKATPRAVSTDALETLGQIHTRQEKRDAIHLAVEPVYAAEVLKPGDHIGIRNGEAFRVPAYSTAALGIVDPFLRDNVERAKTLRR